MRQSFRFFKAIQGLLVAALLAPVVTGAAGSAVAQTATVYFSAPTHMTVRTVGMGGALVGDNPDAAVMFGNPAALSFLDASPIILSHSIEQATKVLDENLSVPLFLGKGEVLGIAASVNHVGQIGDTGATLFDVVQYGYNVSFAYRLVPTFSLGAGVDVRYGNTDASKVWAVLAVFGIYYNPSTDLCYGLSFKGLGDGIKYIFDGTQTVLNNYNVPLSLSLGASFKFPSYFKKPFLYIALESEKVFDEPQFRYRGGIEFIFFSRIATRLGYANGIEGRYPTFGVGLQFGDWKIDMGAAPSIRARETFSFTLSAAIWDQAPRVF